MLKQHNKYAAALAALLGAGLLLNGLAGKLPVLARGFPTACALFPALAVFTLYAAGQRAMKAGLFTLLALWLSSPFYFPLLGKDEFKTIESFVVRCESGKALHRITLRGEEHLALARAAKAGRLKAHLYVRPPERDSKIRLKLNGASLAPPRPAMSGIPAEALEEKNGTVTLNIEVKNPKGKFIYRPAPPSTGVKSFCVGEGALEEMADKRLMVELRFYDGRGGIRRILY